MMIAKVEMNNDKNLLYKVLKSLNVQLTSIEAELQGKELFNAILQKWINASDALLEMMVVHLPSSKEA